MPTTVASEVSLASCAPSSPSKMRAPGGLPRRAASSGAEGSSSVFHRALRGMGRSAHERRASRVPPRRPARGDLGGRSPPLQCRLVADCPHSRRGAWARQRRALRLRASRGDPRLTDAPRRGLRAGHGPGEHRNGALRRAARRFAGAPPQARAVAPRARPAKLGARGRGDLRRLPACVRRPRGRMALRRRRGVRAPAPGGGERRALCLGGGRLSREGAREPFRRPRAPPRGRRGERS